jgi:hypothetical protein
MFAKLIFDNSSVGDKVTVVKSEPGLGKKVWSGWSQI